MAEAIVDGRGSGNYVGVDSANRLMTTGSITSMPAISTTADPATTKIGDAGLGSASLVGAYDGADDVQPMRITGSHLMVAGSISSMPSVSATNESVAKDGTETLGSSTMVGGEWNGSIFPFRIDTGSRLMTAGSIVTMPTVGISGVEDIGSVVIKSAPLLGVSGLVFTDGKMTGSMAMKGVGSVIIQSSSLIGVSGLVFTDGKMTGSMAMKGVGSVIIQSSSLIGVSGAIFDSGDITGSMFVSNFNALGSRVIVSAGSVQVNTGSVRAQAIQITNPWIVLGSTRMMPGADLPITGSVKVLSHTGSLEVFQVTNADMQVQASQETDPWIILGSVQVNTGSIHVTNRVAGSIVNMPSVNATNESVAKDGTEHLGSTTMAGGISNGSVFPFIMALGSFALTAGSITSMPSVSATNESVAKDGTETLGSTTQIGGMMNGSVFPARLDAGSWLMTAGSIVTLPSVVGVSGTLFQNILGSVQVNAGSVRAQSIQITDPWKIVGSVQVDGGSIHIVNRVAGSIVNMPAVNATNESVAKDGTEHLGSSTMIGGINNGSIFPARMDIGSYLMTAGSIVTLPPVVGVSGTLFQDVLGSVQVNTGSVRSQAVQATSPWVTVGSVRSQNIQITNPWEITGSVKVLSHTGSLEVYQTANADMQVQATQETDPWIVLGSVQVNTGSIHVTNRVAGSIVNMPSVTATNESVAKPGTAGLGSMTMLAGVSGANANAMPLQTTAGSILLTQVNVGSVTIGRTVDVSGAIFQDMIGSVRAQAVQITDPWITLGSVQVNAGSITIGRTVEVSGAIFDSGDITGSVVISSAPVLGVSGAKLDKLVGSVTVGRVVEVSGGIFTGGDLVGSVNIATTVLPVSGTLFQDILGSVQVNAGSVRAQAVQITDPWITLGSVQVNAGSITIGRTVEVSGGIFTGGDLTGSIAIQNEMTMQDIGSPNFKTSILIASGGYSDTWKIGGTGSKLEIHGVHISTNLAGTVRLLISGTTNTAAVSPGLISEYFLKYASGATIEKTFSTPFIPAGPGSAIGFGTSSAGSTTVTIYGREVK